MAHFKEVATGQVVEKTDPNEVEEFTRLARWQEIEAPVKPEPKRTRTNKSKQEAPEAPVAPDAPDA